MRDHSLWSAPVCYLPAALRQARSPLRALLVALPTTLLPSVLIGVAIARLLPDLAQPNLAVGTPFAIVLAVIISPVLETLIMAGLITLLRLVLSPTAAVVVSALAWGGAHSLAAPAWGLVIWWPFLIFSTLYLTWRQRSLAAALAMPMAAHTLHNLIPALVIFAGSRAGAG
jgi:membrane protease YdiL (CAAX protease family)